MIAHPLIDLQALFAELDALEKRAALLNAVKHLPYTAIRKVAPVAGQAASGMRVALGQALKGNVVNRVQRVAVPIEQIAARAVQNAPQPSPLMSAFQRSRIVAGKTLSPLTNRLAAADNRLNHGLANAARNVKEWATRTPAQQMESLKRNAIEGVQHNTSRWPHFSRPSTPAFILGDKIMPRPEMNVNSPGWWWRKLSR